MADVYFVALSPAPSVFGAAFVTASEFAVMFATIRKHQQWLFILICGVVIISFVVFFSPDVGTGGGGGPVDFGTVNGRAVSRSEFFAARDEEAIRYFLNWGEWPSQTGGRAPDFIRTNFNQNVIQRVAANLKLEELGIEVGEEAVVARLKLMMRNNDGVYDPAIYQGFVSNGLQRVGMDREDLYRFVRREAAMEQLRDTVAVRGQLVTRAAAEAAFRLENQRLGTEAVFFNASNFLAKANVETNALRTFFTNRAASYRTDAKVQVSYVRFDTTNYLAEAEERFEETVTNLTAAVDKEYQEKGADSFKDDEGKALSEEKAKERIREEALEPFALRAARKAASDFANDLYTEAQKLTAEKKGSFLLETNFISVAQTAGLKVETTKSFSQREGVSDLGLPFQFASAAFQLSGTNQVRIDPVVGDSGVYLMALNKRMPSQPKKFEEVEQEVTEAYKEQEALKLLREHTGEVYKKLTNSIAGGKAFKAAAEEQKLTVVEVAPFAKSERVNLDVSRHSISFPFYSSTAFRTDVGEVCYPQTTGDAGYILYVKERLEADEAKLKDELDEFVDMTRQRRQSAAFQAWMSRELQAAGVAGMAN